MPKEKSPLLWLLSHRHLVTVWSSSSPTRLLRGVAAHRGRPGDKESFYAFINLDLFEEGSITNVLTSWSATCSVSTAPPPSGRHPLPDGVHQELLRPAEWHQVERDRMNKYGRPRWDTIKPARPER